jgi:hypothetical protein
MTQSGAREFSRIREVASTAPSKRSGCATARSYKKSTIDVIADRSARFGSRFEIPGLFERQGPVMATCAISEKSRASA